MVVIYYIAFTSHYYYTETRQLIEKVEDLTSQLRDRDNQNERLKKRLEGNWYFYKLEIESTNQSIRNNYCYSNRFLFS